MHCVRALVVVAVVVALCAAGVAEAAASRDLVVARSQTRVKGPFSFIVDIANKIKMAVSTKIFDWVSSLTCPATAGLDDPHVGTCLERDAIKRGDAMVSDPMFWAQASRAALLSTTAYQPFDKLRKKYDNRKGTEYQFIKYIEAGANAQAVISVRKTIYNVAPMSKVLADCKARGPIGGPVAVCPAATPAMREREWGKYYAALINEKWVAGTAPAMVEVTVRGTQEAADWIIDAAAKKVDAPGDDEDPNNPEKVHWGFRLQFKKLLPDILAGLAPFKGYVQSKQTKLLFTGHSLGGAVTQLLAKEIATQWNVRPLVITFGSPRVGNPAWATAFEKVATHYRFKFTVDMVPEVPTTKMGFRHGATRHYGLVQLPRTSPSRMVQGLGPFQVVCPGECSRARANTALLGLCHSGDAAYNQAVTGLFIYMRDKQHDVPSSYFPTQDTGVRSNFAILDAVEKVYNQDKDPDAAVRTLQCFGQPLCEIARQYPGVTVQQIRTCIKQAHTNVMASTRSVTPVLAASGKPFIWKPIDASSADRVRALTTINRIGQAVPQGPANYQVSRLTEMEYENLAALARQGNAVDKVEAELSKCLTPLTKKNFYAKMENADWLTARGDVISIFNIASAKAGSATAAVANALNPV